MLKLILLFALVLNLGLFVGCDDNFKKDVESKASEAVSKAESAVSDFVSGAESAVSDAMSNAESMVSDFVSDRVDDGDTENNASNGVVSE